MSSYRLSRYGYRAWQIERRDADGKFRPFKYPGNVTAAASGLVDLALAEFTTGDIDDLTDVQTALEELLEAMNTAIADLSQQLQDTAVPVTVKCYSEPE